MDFITARVVKSIIPVIRDFLLDSYESSDKYLDEEQTKQDPGGKSLKKFQWALQKVPHWEKAEIDAQMKKVNNRDSHYHQVLASLFAAYVKMIVNAVRINSKKKSLNVKIPTQEEFIHQCFINAAHNLYENPFVMKIHDSKEREKELNERIEFCIHETISDMVPLPEILQEHIPMSGGSLNFGEEKDDMEDLAPQTAEQMAAEEGVTPSPITESPFPQGPAIQPVVTESRDIPVSNDPDLFSDAPEEKTTPKVNGEIPE